jgi:hypothetical protein
MQKRAISVRVELEAPLDVAWQVLSHLDAYSEWNPFVVDVDLHGRPIEVGTSMTFSVRWFAGGGVKTRETLTRIDPPTLSSDEARLEYEYSGIFHRLRLSSTHRTQKLVALSPQRTAYETRADFVGWGLMFVPIAAVDAGLRAQAHALQARAEWLAGDQRTPWADYAAARSERRPA